MNVSRSAAARLGRYVARLVVATAVIAGSAAAQAQPRQAPGGPSPSAPEGLAQVEAQPVSDEEPIPQKNLLGIIRAGGIVMIPIIFCSFILLVFVFERSIALRRGRVVPRPFVKRFLHHLREGQLDRDQALALCEENGSPVAQVFTGALGKWGRPAVEVEQAILDSGERAANGLRRYVRMFNAVATVSPLLGLLGTVLGMIRAFNEISTSDAMGRPELLAGGISEALIATASGLTIAIPALVCYLFFISRVDRLIIDIDALGQELVSMISSEGLQGASQPRSARASRREPAATAA